MCTSRFQRVIATDGRAAVITEDSAGRRARVSLLALDGPPPGPGDWLVVHSGYAVGRAREEAAAVIEEIRRAADRPAPPAGS